MQQRRTAEEPAPLRTYRPLRQIVVYLCITYGLTLAWNAVTASEEPVTATCAGRRRPLIHNANSTGSPVSVTPSPAFTTRL